MSMSIQERIAFQLAMAKQSHKVTPTASAVASGNPQTVSVAERIAMQMAIVKDDRARAGNRGGNTLDSGMLEKLKSEYQEWLKNAELDMGENMFFVPKDRPAEETPDVADQVNGVSTAEGEMIMAAEESQPVASMPYQATPTVMAPRQSRSRRRKSSADDDA